MDKTRKLYKQRGYKMIEKVIKAYRVVGLAGVIKKVVHRLTFPLKKKYYSFKYENELEYKNPSQDELLQIENDLKMIGVEIHPLFVDKDDFNTFKSKYNFPADYHGGKQSGVWEEKLLEHYIAFKMLGLDDFTNDSIYIDVAACESPWAKMIRDVNGGNIMSYAIDLNTPTKFSVYDYYMQMDATRTNFNNSSVDGVSLQCAYEMFAGNADIELIRELKRILKPNGKAIISPLYMHTHPCHYASPDFYGKGFGDMDSKEYIRWDCYGIYSSRKYDANNLKVRILDLITELGMKYKIYVLKNKEEISKEIYMHFILEVEK